MTVIHISRAAMERLQGQGENSNNFNPSQNSGNRGFVLASNVPGAPPGIPGGPLDTRDLKIIPKQNDDSYLSEVESERLVAAYLKFKTRYIPDIEYTKPETFAYFGLAERYYEDCIKGIYNSYPYDGSKAEKLEWALSASYLDLHFLEYEYPKSKGHISFERGAQTDATSTPYPITENPQYISFTGGPHVGTIYDKSNNRESNLKINGANGNTIEFWLKKDNSSWPASTGKREVIFDIHTPGYTKTDHQYGRITVELNNTSDASASPILLTCKSGSVGVQTLALGSSAVTKATVSDGQWHHYAISILSSTNATTYKLYVDGTLDYTLTPSHSIGPVDRPMNGVIGALAAASHDDDGALGRGQLLASLDELRFWKEERSEKQVGRFWYNPVHGGTDKDSSNASLGLYYKFNEGITGQEKFDKSVLDYSGRVGNGTIVNWTSTMRSSVSAIDSSTKIPVENFTEIGDPIINSENSLVKSVAEKFRDIGIIHDRNNMASLINSVPSFMRDEDVEQTFKDLLQIMASSFDDIFLKIKNLPRMKQFAHQDLFSESGKYGNTVGNNFLLGCEDTYLFEFTGKHTRPWIRYILQSFGLVTTEIFPDATLFETFFDRTEQIRFEHSLEEVKNTILSNIHKNLIHILKTKGTEQSFRNLIRCFGIDSELIKMYAYGRNEEYEIKLRPVFNSIRKKSISFEGLNQAGTVHQTASLSGELGYIPAETVKKPLTLEGSFSFSKNTEFDNSEITRASLFGMHAVTGSSVPLSPHTWHSNDHASLQVYFNRRQKYSQDGHFELSSSSGIITKLTSSLMPAVYDNTNWNISVRVGRPSEDKYLIEFSGYEYQLDVLRNSFHETATITQTQYQQLSVKDKAVYLGAHYQNFTGSLLSGSDSRAYSFSAHRDILSNEELQQRAQNPSFYGRRDPMRITEFDDGENLRKSEALILRWQFENLKKSDEQGKMNVVDFSGQAGSHNITKLEYPGLALGFTSRDKAISQDFLPVVEYNEIGNLYTSDRINIKDTETSKFEADSRPVTYFYNFEKSMYQVISNEMINLFSGLVGYNTLLGNPVNKYRTNYK